MSGLHLLNSTAQRMVTDARLLPPAEYARRYGESAIGRQTWADVRAYQPDQPLPDELVIEHSDERERKYDKAQAVVSFRGRRPVIVVGGGTEHTGDLLDMARDMIHYGEEVPESVAKRVKPDIKAALADYDEQSARTRAGKKTYGASTT